MGHTFLVVFWHNKNWFMLCFWAQQLLKSGNCLVDLKVELLCAMESSSASSKRTRPLGIGNPAICCLVDGCASDLSKCRDYHRRHKVCELHSKTPKVTIAGQEQRFCQQCSRFHSLEEFDEGKRSCRKRLDGHNRRRRKPQAEPLSMNSARFFPGHQGSEYMNFRVPQLFPPSPVGSSSWGAAMKPENESVFFNLHPQSSFHRRHGGSFSGPPPGKDFSIMEGGAGCGDGSMCHQHLIAPKSSSSGRKMCPGELNQVVNTGRALSLLSSSPCQEAGQSCCIEGQQGIHIPSHHHSPLMLHYGDGSGLTSSYPCPLQHRTPQPSLLLDHGAHPGLLHCQEPAMFQTRPDSPPDNPPTHHTLSFSWD